MTLVLSKQTIGTKKWRTNERTNERNYTPVENRTPKIHAILRDSNYKLDLFAFNSIENLESTITEKQGKKGVEYQATCLIRNKQIKLTPEEIKAVEDQVNEWILADLPVVFDEYDKAYAKDT